MDHSGNPILQNEEVRRLLDRMRAQCAVRECCEKDIREKISGLLSKASADGFNGLSCSREEVTEAVIGKLKEEEFLSDGRYAAAFARDKAHLLGWGPQKIRYALLAKRIDEAIIDEALSLVDSSAAESQLERMLGKKLASLRSSRKAMSGEDIKVRLIRFATGRGYPYDATISAIEKLGKSDLE